MTMFFTSEVTVPFQNMKDVLMEYPDWKLKILKHTQLSTIQVYSITTGGLCFFLVITLSASPLQPRIGDDPLFAQMFNRILNNPVEAVIPSLKIGLKQMQTNRDVLYIHLGLLKGYMKVHATSFDW
jgi:DNA-binding sugar fermentation-stimulating protein